jgi:hypothetical protein
MLWHPNGQELHSTPLKWSNDQLEYHGVFLSFTISRSRGISTTWSLSPLQLMITKKHGCKGGKSNTHTRLKARAQTRTLVTTWALSSHTEFSTQEELKLLSQRIKCARMKSWCLEMIKECLCISSMRLGVPFIAPRQLGAVGGNQGGNSCLLSGGAPNSPVHHRKGTGQCPVQIAFLKWHNWPLKTWSRWRIGHCLVCTGQSGAPIWPLAQPRVTRGLRGRPLAHRTVRCTTGQSSEF